MTQGILLGFLKVTVTTWTGLRCGPNLSPPIQPRVERLQVGQERPLHQIQNRLENTELESEGGNLNAA